MTPGDVSPRPQKGLIMSFGNILGQLLEQGISGQSQTEAHIGHSAENISWNTLRRSKTHGPSSPPNPVASLAHAEDGEREGRTQLTYLAPPDGQGDASGGPRQHQARSRPTDQRGHARRCAAQPLSPASLDGPRTGA